MLRRSSKPLSARYLSLSEREEIALWRAASAVSRKPRPTFADALAAVRRQFWREQGLLLSAP
jgi:hypothetical protein